MQRIVALDRAPSSTLDKIIRCIFAVAAKPLYHEGSRSTWENKFSSQADQQWWDNGSSPAASLLVVHPADEPVQGDEIVVWETRRQPAGVAERNDPLHASRGQGVASLRLTVGGEDTRYRRNYPTAGTRTASPGAPRVPPGRPVAPVRPPRDAVRRSTASSETIASQNRPVWVVSASTKSMPVSAQRRSSTGRTPPCGASRSLATSIRSDSKLSGSRAAISGSTSSASLSNSLNAARSALSCCLESQPASWAELPGRVLRQYAVRID